MSNLLVGGGGWAYFRVPGTDSLSAYSQAFNFVEVNSTYYQMSSPPFVPGWRARVPPTFCFSLRCPREIVDRYGLKLEPKAQRLMRRVEAACDALEAPVLTLLISPESPANQDDLVERLEEFLRAFHAHATRVAVEFRNMGPTEGVARVLKENGAIHCVDLSRQEPAYEAPTLYSRLFGKGKDNMYEFDNNELREIASKASQPKFEKSILAFHGVRMYRDAARIKTFVETGHLPSITNCVGLDSAREVLKEDTRFPTTKSELVERQGWKLFNWDSNDNVRMRQVLEKLPEGRYQILQEVLTSIQSKTGLA